MSLYNSRDKLFELSTNGFEDIGNMSDIESPHLSSLTETKRNPISSQPDNQLEYSITTKAGGDTETPNYRPPPPMPSSAKDPSKVSKWKRRGRLGLGKPKRGNTAADENTATNMSLGTEQPDSMEFLDYENKSAKSGYHSSAYGSLDNINDSESMPNPNVSSFMSVEGGEKSELQPEKNIPAYNNNPDNSDVSMQSNPKSRSTSPVAAFKTPGSNMSKSSAYSNSNNSKYWYRNNESRESLLSDSGKRSNRNGYPPVSPALSYNNVTVTSRQKLSSPENSGKIESVRQQYNRYNLSPESSAINQKQKQSSANAPSPSPPPATRFEQYEKRVGEASPQYKSPLERHREWLGSFSRSQSAAAIAASESNLNDKKEQPEVSYHSSQPVMGYSPPPADMPPKFSTYVSPRPAARQVPSVNESSQRPASSGRNRMVTFAVSPQMTQATQSVEDDNNESRSDKKPTTTATTTAINTPVTNHTQNDSQPGTSQRSATMTRTPSAMAMDPKRTLMVNGRAYQKISITGRGGSSKVYKAMSAKHDIYAIKRVSCSRADASAVDGYVNEILLLRKFEGNPQIIQLYDAEMNKERGLIHMVMEFGETDLASVLKRHGDKPLGMNIIRLYWEQMLRAVQTIHEERVVHADLKPANYLLVKGSLKLIDFGIAKAIGNDTTNIHRENQIGTVNYMSPEAITETNAENGKRMMKLGRASDIWSLGIILYQMCYGRTPFAQLALFKKLASIPDPSFVIPYPKYMAGCQQVNTERDPNADESNPQFADGTDKFAVPVDLLQVMKGCLQRDPSKRITIPELLTSPLLCPDSHQHMLNSAMSQMLSLVKRNPQILDQWDMSESQNNRILESLERELSKPERKTFS